MQWEEKIEINKIQQILRQTMRSLIHDLEGDKLAPKQTNQPKIHL